MGAKTTFALAILADQRMKIGLDATPLSVATGGIRRYTEELAKALEATFPDDQCCLLAESESGLNRRWWSLGLPRLLASKRFDVFHGTDFAVPYAPVCAAVMTVHDLSPWKREPWQNASSRVRRRTPVLLGLGLATMVITPTDAVRAEAIERFRLRPERVVTVYEAPSHRFIPVTAATEQKPYFLFVGTVEARKNLDVALEAWRSLRAQADFVVAGRGSLPGEPGLTVLGAVPDERLPALYAGAAALVFPSLYEGFGLPVLEAMRCGAPVITSRDPALVEVSGQAAIHADASQPRQWLEAMQAVLNDPSPWRDAGYRRAAQFTWEKAARQTYQVYTEAIRRFRGGA
jgi:glycosyltransferase involved in cell wall biosynthesis